MKRLLLVAFALLILVGCSPRPTEYPFPNRNEPIESIELFYHPWYEDDTKPFLEFQLIRTLEDDEIPGFMEAVYALDTKSGLLTPPSNYGTYFARVNYENGDAEYLGTAHIEFVECGDQAWAVGYYYFPGDAFDKLFYEYAGNLDHLLPE